MYIVPSPAPGFPRPGAPSLSPRAMRQRSQQASVARQLMGMSRSGLMGCNLRGHYLAGLAQDDDLDVTAAPIDTSLITPDDSSAQAILLPDDSYDVTSAPISTSLVAPAAATPLTNTSGSSASLISAISSAIPSLSKILGGGSASANPAAGSSQQRGSSAKSSSSSLLLVGALGVGALLLLGGGR